LRDTVSELLSMDEPRKRFAAMMSGLDIHYDLGEGHPLLGRRMPDLDLVTPGGTVRAFTLLHDAYAVLLNLGKPWGFDISPWAHRVLAIDAKYAGNWELPVLGQVAAPAAVLIRPDGYIAWVGDGHRYRIARRADYLVRTTASGLSVTTVRIATNGREQPEFHDVFLWRRQAEFACHMTKGCLGYVEGRLEART
jgi:hypothetical protein